MGLPAMPCLDANDLARFLDRGEPPHGHDDFERHLDACADCRALMTELARTMAPTDAAATAAAEPGPSSDATPPEHRALLWQAQSGAELVERGSQLGRYVVLDPIGEGAMGIVYRAYDPELDRDVALKLVRVLGEATARSNARGRLLREAQAMAQLSHPNVVAVHDASIFGAHVFVAMELVEGQDLETWLQAERRTWRQIVAAFIEAGRGLAAAHDAGLVHRDVKPSNILVGSDGRVRITDFGLAAAAATAATGDVSPADVAADADRAPSPGPSLASRLTAIGTTIGTPAYMSPEARAGQPGDAKSDQYSFAVALCEAVSGARTASPRIPRPLRAPLRRAMDPVAGARFPSMEPLLDALASRSRPPLRKLWPAALAGVLGAAMALGYWAANRRSQQVTCDAPTDQLIGVWDPARRAAPVAAFAATGAPRAEDVAARTARMLDGFASAWQAAHVEACRATYVRHAQSTQLFDLRMACLHEELGRLRATTDAFITADRALVARALTASDFPTNLARCARADLSASQALPADPAHRQRLTQSFAELRRIDTLGMRGQYAQQVTALAPLTRALPALDYPRFTSEVEAKLGEATWRSGAPAVAAEHLHRAVAAAKLARSTELEADALLLLVAVVGYEQGRHGEGLQLALLAESTIRALGDDARLGKLMGHRAAIHLAQGDYQAATEGYERALELLERAHGKNDRRVALTYKNLAIVATQRDEEARALDLYSRALPILEHALGPRHPEIAGILRGRSIPLANLARLDDARRDLTASLELLQESLGADHPDVAFTHSLLGAVELRAEKPAKALEHFGAALAGYQRAAKPADHPQMATLHSDMGRAHAALGQLAPAREALERALKIWQQRDTHSDEVAQAQFALADVLWRQGPRQGKARLAALALARAALDHWSRDGDSSAGAVVAWLKERR
ncbi:MAG TPA: serine/threonine-protein kinase [Kofleriaceae bacterium]|nr:serine/threonine-protein kinase [Kofleriaceae bacterium]